MKKVLIILVVMFVSLNIMAQQQDSVEVQISNAERIVDKYTAKMFEFAENTAKALEQPAKEIFESVVRLQVARGIVLAIGAGICLVVFIVSAFYFNIWFKKMNGFNVLLMIIIVIGFIVFLYQSMIRLMSPEWYGIKEIINLF